MARFSRTALIAAASALLAVGAAHAQGVAARAACGSSGTLPSAQDLRYVRGYRRLLAKAPGVWPGWRTVPPLLQRKGRCEFLLGYPSQPRRFARVAGLQALGRPVYAAPAGTLTPAVVASTWRVGTVWTVMVPMRDELQRAVDRQLGPGAVHLTDTAYERALVHEAFHAHQMRVTGGAPPSFGSTLEEPQAVALLARAGDAEARLAAEGAALAAALAAPSLGEARRQAATFLRLRADRRDATGASAAIAAFEQQLEWGEGSARYADLRLVAQPRSAFLVQLADRAPRADGLRGRWEDLGAAEAMLLDRLSTGWKAAALPGRSSLEALLREAV